jgi:hypothetical protein
MTGDCPRWCRSTADGARPVVAARRVRGDDPRHGPIR